MGLFNKVVDLFRNRPKKGVRGGPPNPRPSPDRRIPRITGTNYNFKKCDKCGRSFAKNKLEHLEEVEQDLCKDCLGVVRIYLDMLP